MVRVAWWLEFCIWDFWFVIFPIHSYFLGTFEQAPSYPNIDTSFPIVSLQYFFISLAVIFDFPSLNFWPCFGSQSWRHGDGRIMYRHHLLGVWGRGWRENRPQASYVMQKITADYSNQSEAPWNGYLTWVFPILEYTNFRHVLLCLGLVTKSLQTVVPLFFRCELRKANRQHFLLLAQNVYGMDICWVMMINCAGLYGIP